MINLYLDWKVDDKKYITDSSYGLGKYFDTFPFYTYFQNSIETGTTFKQQ